MAEPMTYDDPESNDLDLPEDLIFMRRVMFTKKHQDQGNPGLTAYRDLQEAYPDKFLALKAKLESDWVDQKIRRLAALQQKKAGPDEGTDAAIALCEKLIRDEMAKIKGEV